MSAQTLIDFLVTVDTSPPNFVEAIAKGLFHGGFDSPATLNKADAVEVIAMFPTEGEGSLTPAKKAFIRRAIDVASRPIVPPAAASGGPVVQQVSRLDELRDVFGAGASAESVAAALAAKAPPIDVHDLLSKIACGDLPSTMLPQVSIWQALAADLDQAGKHGRKAFTYVDFTSSVMLPPWLPRDAVGGKKAQREAPELDPDASTASLQALSSALQAAVAEPRSLRSPQQWSSVFWRYAPMAVAMGQLSWSSVIAYHATIMQLWEQERLARSTGFIPVLYDVALRKSWTRRCQQNDPHLDIPADCAKINKEVLETVRCQVAVAASCSTLALPASRISSSSSSLWVDAAADGALAKAGAAAQAITRRAEAASRELAKAEQSLSAREESLNSASAAPHTGGKRR